VVAIGALLVLGTSIVAFADERGVQLEALARLPGNMWLPADCPLCRSGVPLEIVGR
jgi:orotate phosphoribosyltransferase